MDSQAEIKTNVRTELERAKAADQANRQLMHEIAEFPDDQITPENAALIAGLFVGRAMETGYAGAFEIASRDENENSKYRLIHADIFRNDSGSFQLIFDDASRGDYGKLKAYMNTRSNSLKQGHSELAVKLGEKFSVIASKMQPEGKPLKLLIPAWMEEPMPLREQLRQLEGVNDK